MSLIVKSYRSGPTVGGHGFTAEYNLRCWAIAASVVVSPSHLITIGLQLGPFRVEYDYFVALGKYKKRCKEVDEGKRGFGERK